MENECLVCSKPESLIRVMVRSTYSMQKLRIQLGNRIFAQFRLKVLGITSSQTEEEMAAEEAKILKQIRNSYDLLTDGVIHTITARNFKGRGIISDFTEYVLIKQYLDMQEAEENSFKQLTHELKKYPIYQEFLSKVKGVGPAISAVIISEMDPTAATYPSSFCKYAGLDVVTMIENPDKTMTPLEQGEGRTRNKRHLVTVQYKDKEGETQEKLSVTYKPFLKSKLLGVLGPSFIKAGIKNGDNKYGQLYYDYKTRLQNMPKHKEKTKLHIHRMAIRYIVKHFLIDLHIKWRELEGLPVSTPYHEGKLGIIHGEGER